MTTSFQHLVLSWLPAASILALAAVAIWGESGLMVRAQLQAQLEASYEERSRLDEANQQLLLDLRQMREDPLVQERLIADELGRVRAGSTLVRFR